MSNFDRNIFTNIPVEYMIPRKTKVIFVADYFTSEVQGGAELTSEALIKKSPSQHAKVFKLHCSSLTRELLEENRKDKYWIFGNYVSLPMDLLAFISDSGIRYSVIEYDFKYCVFRSEQRHQTQTGQPCNCAKDVHGLTITRFMQKADHIFWMSEGQKKLFQKAVPAIDDPSGNQSVILGSIFEDQTLDYLKELSTKYLNSELKEKKVYSVLGSGSWIKGIEETQKWCQLNRKNFRVIPGMPYKGFLDELAKGYGFIFMPLDSDTCPRVVIEAKLLGLGELVLNNNVLMKNDPWFQSSSREELDSYLRGSGERFWNTLKDKIDRK